MWGVQFRSHRHISSEILYVPIYLYSCCVLETRNQLYATHLHILNSHAQQHRRTHKHTKHIPEHQHRVTQPRSHTSKLQHNHQPHDVQSSIIHFTTGARAYRKIHSIHPKMSIIAPILLLFASAHADVRSACQLSDTQVNTLFNRVVVDEVALIVLHRNAARRLEKTRARVRMEEASTLSHTRAPDETYGSMKIQHQRHINPGAHQRPVMREIMKRRITKCVKTSLEHNNAGPINTHHTHHSSAPIQHNLKCARVRHQQHTTHTKHNRALLCFCALL